MLACMMCQIDPQSLSLAVPAAQATLVAVPFFLRSRIRTAVGGLLSRYRSRRGGTQAASSSCSVAGEGPKPE